MFSHFLRRVPIVNKAFLRQNNIFFSSGQLEISIANNTICKQRRNLYSCGRLFLKLIISETAASENFVLPNEISPVTSHSVGLKK